MKPCGGPSASESRGSITPEATGGGCAGSASPAGSDPYNHLSRSARARMGEPCTVLNATYEPINVTAVRRAMCCCLKACAGGGTTPPSASAAHSHTVSVGIRRLA